MIDTLSVKRIAGVPSGVLRAAKTAAVKLA
jgi:hypothetical protein